MYKILTLFWIVLVMAAPALQGQCIISNQDIELADFTTTDIEITVADIVNNNLGSPDQGLCSIKLHFKHQFVGDITLRLQSPSGQSVTLFGPAGSSTAPTTFVNWQVNLIQCDDQAQPDALFNNNFRNDESWGNFVTYTGSYYPFMGCLEDFNFGPVNGLWKLSSTDVSMFGDGELSYVELVFCDGGTSSCFICKASRSELEDNYDGLYCEGDPILNLDLSPQFLDSLPNADHSYRYILTQDNEVIDVINTLDLTGLDFGTYNVCGISGYTTQLNELSGDLIGEDYDDLADLLFQEGYCAILSNNCIDITIIEQPETVETQRIICSGDSVVVNGISYSETGVYNTTASTESCDTAKILNLTVIDTEAVISYDTLFLSCDYPTATLNASASTLSIQTELEWFSTDGTINPSQANNTIINISESGTYGLSIRNSFCYDTAYVTIEKDASFPTFSFDVGVLTCSTPLTTIDMTPSQPLESISWTGPITASVEDILVGSAGTYYLTAVAENGCTGEDSVIVTEDIEVFPPMFITDTITCARPEATIRAMLPDSLSFLFDWSGGSLVNGMHTADTVLVDDAITYNLRLTSLDNGCIQDFEVLMPIDTSRVISTVSSNTYSCAEDSIYLKVDNYDMSLVYEWYFENAQFHIGDSALATAVGSYHLHTTNTNGCKDTISYLLPTNLDTLTLDITDVTITCVSDSIQLFGIQPGAIAYQWSGPLGFQSFEANPYTDNPGLYHITVTNANGCESRGSSNVIAGNDIPFVTFQSDVLDCNITEVTIIPSDTTNLIFDWINNGVSDTTSARHTVNQPGFYSVVIMDTLTQCGASYEAFVSQNIETSTIDWIPDTLNCLVKSIHIDATYEYMDSIQWTLPDGTVTTEQNPFINNGGLCTAIATAPNGCILEQEFMVVQDTFAPVVEWNKALLNCDGPTTNLEFLADIPILDGYVIYNNEVVSQTNSFEASEVGMYRGVVRATNYCVDSLDVQINQDTVPPSAEIEFDDNLSCLHFVSQLNAVTAEPQLTYTWTGPSITSDASLDTILLDAPGTYVLEVKDTANCVTLRDIEITSTIDFPELTLDYDTITCNTPTVSVSMSSDLDLDSIRWSGPIDLEDVTFDFQTDMPGTYLVRVRGENDCITEEQINIQIDTVTANISVADYGILDCNIPILEIPIMSDIEDVQYAYTDPANVQIDNDTIFASLPGVYEIAVTPQNGCTKTLSIELAQDTLKPTLIIGESPSLTCADGKAILSVETDAGVSYMWDGPSGVLTDPSPLVILAGDYGITVTNESGCSSSGILQVIDDRQGPEIELRDTFFTCDMLAVPLPYYTEEVLGEVTHQWQGPEGFVSTQIDTMTNKEGIYIMYSQSMRNGCVSIDTAEVTFMEVKPEYTIFSENLNCIKDTVPVGARDISDDLSAIWYDENEVSLANDSLLLTAAQDLTLIVIGANLCADTAFVEILEDFEKPSLSIELNEPFECENKEVILNGIVDQSDAIMIEWSTSDGEIVSGSNIKDAMVNGAGTYYIQTTFDRNGCTSMDSITLVDGIQSLIGLELEVQDPLCLGDSTGWIEVTEVLGGHKPFTYRIDSSAFSAINRFDTLKLGSYEIKVRDSVGCEVFVSADIEDGFLFQTQLPADTSIVIGENILLNPTFNTDTDNLDSLFWYVDGVLVDCENCLSIDQSPEFSANYILQAKTTDACISSDTIRVIVDRNPTVWVANVFAPGTADNGLLYVQQTLGVERVVSMQVFDKWANEMFAVKDVPAGDPTYAWNGSYKGKFVNSGVYMLQLDILLKSGERISYMTDVTVIR